MARRKAVRSAPRILLGISGGIAAYKCPDLVRRLRDCGCEVTCVLTCSATKLVAPAALQTVSGNKVYHELFDESAWDIGHIKLADWADTVLLAPATANLIGKMAHGIADDLLTTLILAVKAPVVVAPAMNSAMLSHPAVRQNLDILRKRGYKILGPEFGELACGRTGSGRLMEIPELAKRVAAIARAKK